VVQRALGALPVAAEFSRRLGIREIVDRLCPMREVATARVTHGQVIEALIANRLTSPSPLVGVVDWARDFAVEEVYGSCCVGESTDALDHSRVPGQIAMDSSVNAVAMRSARGTSVASS
jgi:hypothetical protein